MSEVVGWLVGIVCFVVICLFSINYSEDRWHQNVVRAHSHFPHGWQVHQGVVIQQDQPEFADNPPDRKSTIKFADYYGRSTQFETYLPYRSVVGSTVQVDVSADGHIYVPQSTNGNDQVYDNPLAAHAAFWPAWGIVVIGVFLNFCVSLIIGLLVFALVDALENKQLQGRLSVR